MNEDKFSTLYLSLLQIEVIRCIITMTKGSVAENNMGKYSKIQFYDIFNILHVHEKCDYTNVV